MAIKAVHIIFTHIIAIYEQTPKSINCKGWPRWA